MDDSYNLPNKHTVQGALLVLFGCCKLSHMTFPKLRKKELFVKLSKFTKWKLFLLKMVLGCLFEIFLSFANSSFFLSLRKNMWLNLQQLKTRGDI